MSKFKRYFARSVIGIVCLFYCVAAPMLGAFVVTCYLLNWAVPEDAD